MHRHQLTVAVVLVVAAGLLAACSNASGGARSAPSGDGLPDGATVLGVDPDRAAPAAPVDGAAAGGTVTVLSERSDAFLTLDPSDSYYPGSESVLSGLVTRSLTQYVYDSEQGTMVLVPDIATDLGTPNADFTAWTFTIRDGVRYEDGTEVTADDVAYGITRSFDRAAFPSGPSFSNDFLLNGDTYKGPYVSGTLYPGVSVDGNTVTIRAEHSFPDMPYLAAWTTMGPIPVRGSDPATYGEHPLATGPYKVGAYSAGKSLTLVRNKEWDPDTDPGRHAYPDRYKFDLAAGPGDRIDATILGGSEAAKTTISMDNRATQDYRKAQKLGRLTVGSQPCTYFWLPDYRKITDIRVRQAIGYAFPYKDHARLLSESTGVTSSAGTSILPPSFPGRQDYNPLTTQPGDTDPDQARALLKEAGYAPGEFELTILYDPYDETIPENTDVYEESLEAGGFKATLQSTPDHEEYLTERDDPNAPINVRILGWCSDWPSGGAWFPFLFQSGADFQAHFAEPTIDAEIDRISRLPLDDQPGAWGALDKTIMTDFYPAIIIGYRSATLLHGSGIANMHADNLFTTPTWKDIYVAR